MPRNQRNPPRKPATKFAHLRKKMARQKLPVNPLKKG